MTKKTISKKAKVLAVEESDSDAQARLEILKKMRIVIRAAQQHSLWIEKQCGVNGAQLWLMQELHEEPDSRVGELATKLAIHQTTASNLLDGLEKRGYVSKMRDPKDQRVVRVSLTEEGMNVFLSSPRPARGLLPEALRQLDTEKIRELNSGLQGLLDSIDALDEGFALLPLPFTM
ncbi:MarR family transcriptional regulator [Undibacterium sp. 14-3-2]|uniref:MarR family winged helix-turn-helix transcriptional regulator n=1 Tax=Undibacterium sp. 14-3-2 TaxID=2800129 RepID=UPI0019062777|nr:MarR family transcriptional regulator [Undibacterium sp. 14-3-2]MBK1888546.1 MarR family transcriptional regulator [Undibacterium sp. 14-3-2]